MLTGLSELDIDDQTFDDVQLMKLSTLTRLTWLHRRGNGSCGKYDTSDITFENEVRA